MDDFRQLLNDPWIFLVVGYLVSIAIETPVLLVGKGKASTPEPSRLPLDKAGAAPP